MARLGSKFGVLRTDSSIRHATCRAHVYDLSVIYCHLKRSGMIAFRQAMPAARRTTDRTTFVTLPVVSQIFVVAVSLLGLAALTAAITAFESDRLLLVAALMAL